LQIKIGGAVHIEQPTSRIDDRDASFQLSEQLALGTLRDAARTHSVATVRRLHWGAKDRRRRPPGGLNESIDRRRHRHARAAKEPPLLRDRRERGVRCTDGFGAAEEEGSARLQSVLKNAQNSLLRLRLEVDQQIPAANQVKPRERRL